MRGGGGGGGGGEQSISAHVNIPASTMALHASTPLSFIFTEGGYPRLSPNTTHIKWLLRCTLKEKLCCLNCNRIVTQCMLLNTPDVCED